MNNEISHIPFHRPMKISDEELDEVYNNINECIDSGMFTNNKNVRNLPSYYDINYKEVVRRIQEFNKEL